MAMKVRYNVVGGEIVSEQRGGVKSFYLADAIGSTIGMTDITGTVTDRIEYWPYGSIASRTGTSASPFQYVGSRGYFTDAVSRTYVRMRYLFNSAGRWLTPDPAKYSDSFNLYQYALGQPVSFADPSGLKTGDPLLDSKDVIKQMQKMIENFKRNNKGFESGFLIIEEGGKYKVMPLPDGTTYTNRSITFPQGYMYPTNVVGMVHTHPGPLLVDPGPSRADIEELKKLMDDTMKKMVSGYILDLTKDNFAVYKYRPTDMPVPPTDTNPKWDPKLTFQISDVLGRDYTKDYVYPK